MIVTGGRPFRCRVGDRTATSETAGFLNKPTPRTLHHHHEKVTAHPPRVLRDRPLPLDIKVLRDVLAGHLQRPLHVLDHRSWRSGRYPRSCRVGEFSIDIDDDRGPDLPTESGRTSSDLHNC